MQNRCDWLSSARVHVCTCPQVYTWLGVTPPRGVLLHGPPGCGKTALAHAIAHETGVPFLRLSAPEIVSGMSGESEAKLRSLFKHAAAIAPCIVFIGVHLSGQRAVAGIPLPMFHQSVGQIELPSMCDV